MHLDRGKLRPRQRITQGNGIVSERARIDDNPIRSRSVLLNIVDQRSLMIRLKVLDSGPQFRAACAQHLNNLRERGRAINLRLARAQRVQIGSVYDKDTQGHLLIVPSLTALTPVPFHEGDTLRSARESVFLENWRPDGLSKSTFYPLYHTILSLSCTPTRTFQASPTSGKSHLTA